MENDTIRLLRECNAGIKMGVSSLDDVIEHVQSESLRNLLAKSKETHTKLGNTTHEYLNEYHDDGKEPAIMAKMMSKVTQLKEAGVAPDLIRLSVGIEHIDDIIGDLEQALANID